MAELELLEGIAEIPRGEWNSLVHDESPFLEWEWLASLERAGVVGEGTGWHPRPLVARRGAALVAACPLYVKTHSEGEFVFDWSWAEAAERAGIRYYPKLLVGIPFTPVAGARFLVAPGEDRRRWAGRLAGALREICLENGFSGVHVNFCRADEVPPGGEAGYHSRMGFQYHWTNAGYASFDDYLARLRSKRRNQIRRERRALAEQGIALETRVGDALDRQLTEPLFALYLSTIEKRIWGRQYLNLRFFELLWDQFRDRLCVVLARRGEEILAGTLNVQKGDTLYGRYWGSRREVRHLHFNVCYYAAIEHCIQRGLARFEPGAGGDYKQMRGFDAEPTWSLHFLAEPRLASAVQRFLAAERVEAQQAIAWLRDHSAYKDAGPPPGGPT